ncbi:flagellar biosynthetic protein FliR [Pelosinus sp. sgz500959]|uniref:flagellar biosynthetic protein FliR n=1 Tax=Pelosinus sp. sgz500959 TaxID=3242472 RepID=UPI00366DA3EA
MDFFTLIQGQLGFFLLIFVRISGIFMIAPIFGSRNITGRVKACLALIITYIIFPLIFNSHTPIPEQFLPYFFMVMGELIIGLILGFVSSLIFSAIQMAGQLLDMQIGFGIINMLDPLSGQQAPLIGNFKYILALILFLAMNGHHVLLSALFASFKLIPVTGLVVNVAIAEFMINMIGNMFILALKISLPVIVSLLLTDMALGILARTMPQMNIFVVGVPGKIIIGIFVLSIGLPFYIFFLELAFDGMYKNVFHLLSFFYSS